MQRRRFLIAAASVVSSAHVLAGDADARSFPIGFSLYGMKALPVADGIKACAAIGFECTELPLMADWPTDGAKLGDDEVENIRQSAATNKLPIAALMENLKLAADEAGHQANLARLKRAGAIANMLSAAQPPVVETILGGAPKDWDAAKQQMASRLKDWAKVAETSKFSLAIKAHVSNAAHLPEHLLWLLDQVQSDALRVAYDFSHFQLRGLTLKQSLLPLLKQTAFIHVKDATGEVGKFKFLLPGEGKIDYREYFDILAAHDYRGSVIVEVSGQIHSQSGYNPLEAARTSHKALFAAAR